MKGSSKIRRTEGKTLNRGANKLKKEQTRTPSSSNSFNRSRCGEINYVQQHIEKKTV
jgi:hypothetical protein